MAAIPSVTETVRDYGLNVVEPASMTPLIIGPCSSGDSNIVQLFGSSVDLRAEHGEGLAVENACCILDNGGGPVAMLRTTASIAATAGQVLPTYGTTGTNGSLTEAGTTPPDITPSGSPNGHYLMKVDIQTGGTLGTATFRWSIDDGATWVAENVATTDGASGILLATATFDTGITITMTAGTYNADNEYSWTATPGGGQIAVSGSSNYDARLLVEIVTSGALGVARFRYSCDTYSGDTAAERTYSENLYVPAGGTFAVPGLGITLTFDDTPTAFVAGDSYVVSLEAACSNSTNMGTAFTAIAASPIPWRFCVFVTGKGNGDAVAHALLGVALQTHLTTLANSAKYRRGMIAATHEDTAAATIAAWDDVSAIRLLVAYGQVRRYSTKPFSGWAFPITNAVDVFAARAAGSAPSTDPKRVRSGSLSMVAKIFHDEYRSPSSLDDVKVSTLRPYENRDGFYITQGRLKSPDGSDFTVWPRGIVMDIACETVNEQLTLEIGRGCRIETRVINGVTYEGTIDERDALAIEENVSAALVAQLMAPQNAEGFEGHITDVRFRITRTNNFLSTGIVIGEVGILPLNHIDYITTTLGFVVSIPAAA
jgi:hypothetical protein